MQRGSPGFPAGGLSFGFPGAPGGRRSSSGSCSGSSRSRSCSRSFSGSCSASSRSPGDAGVAEPKERRRRQRHSQGLGRGQEARPPVQQGPGTCPAQQSASAGTGAQPEAVGQRTSDAAKRGAPGQPQMAARPPEQQPGAPPGSQASSWPVPLGPDGRPMQYPPPHAAAYYGWGPSAWGQAGANPWQAAPPGHATSGNHSRDPAQPPGTWDQAAQWEQARNAAWAAHHAAWSAPPRPTSAPQHEGGHTPKRRVGGRGEDAAGGRKTSNGGSRGDDSADHGADAGGRGSRAPAHLSDINAIPVNWRARQESSSGPGFAAAGADVQSSPPDHSAAPGTAPESSAAGKDAVRPPTPPRPPTQGGTGAAPWMTPGASAWATPTTPATTPVPTRAPGTSVVGAAWAG